MSEQPRKKTVRKDRPPIVLPAWEVADAAAIQACVRGDASPAQQQRAINWIIYGAANTYDFAFMPGDTDRETNIALGRQFVGMQIVKLLSIKTAALRRQPDDTPSTT
jgi:hypothetical protein